MIWRDCVKKMVRTRSFNKLLKSKSGRLNRVRFGQASISNGLEVMILGGTPRNNHRPEM